MSSNTLLARLQTLYGAPDTDDPAAYIAEYARLLAKYSAKELAEAGDIVIGRNRYKTWPTIGDCIAACEDVRERTAGRVPRKFTETHPEWSPARANRAASTMPIGGARPPVR